MTENQNIPPTQPKSKGTKLRSPAYPGINLETAIKRADGLYKKERRNAVPYPVAVSHWGFGAKSSGGLVAVAAMKSFGLIQDVERGPSGRVIKLTDLAFQVLLDERPDSAERAAAIKHAALMPRIHGAIWKKYKTTEGVSDANLKHDLVFNFKFNENTVDEFIKEYKDTIRFAKLAESDTLSVELEDKIRLEDEVEEEEVMQETQGSQQLAKQNQPLPLKRQDHPSAGTRQDVFSLAEGPVTIQWPATLSADSFEDFSAWLDILKRKIGRSVVGMEPKD
jgi:hypothetical protein